MSSGSDFSASSDGSYDSASSDGSEKSSGKKEYVDYEEPAGFKEQQGKVVFDDMSESEQALSNKIFAIISETSMESMMDSIKLEIKKISKPQYIYPLGLLLGVLMKTNTFEHVVAIKNKIVKNSAGIDISDADIIRYYRLVML